VDSTLIAMGKGRYYSFYSWYKSPCSLFKRTKQTVTIYRRRYHAKTLYHFTEWQKENYTCRRRKNTNSNISL